MEVTAATTDGDGTKCSTDPYPVGGWSPDPVGSVLLRGLGELNMALVQEMFSFETPDGLKVQVVYGISDGSVRAWCRNGDERLDLGIKADDIADAVLKAWLER